IRTILRSLCPESVRRGWWYLSDPDWRAQYRTAKDRSKVIGDLQKQAHDDIWRQTGGRIASGPFQGLQYGHSPQIGIFPQKLLGTYECELWPIVEEIVAKPYSLVIDVGAAEGYYVCGLAKRMPEARVIAFETQRTCHSQLRAIAVANGLQERITIRGFCSPSDLAQAVEVGNRTLVVCDSEGGERDLLDMDRVPALRNVDVLVEVHENLAPGVGAAIERQF